MSSSSTPRPQAAMASAAAECALAHEILEGGYTLGCKLGDTESKTVIDVRRYTLPKFKIDVSPDRPYYAPGETAHLTVQSDYFFGKPVAESGRRGWRFARRTPVTRWCRNCSARPTSAAPRSLLSRSRPPWWDGRAKAAMRGCASWPASPTARRTKQTRIGRAYRHHAPREDRSHPRGRLALVRRRQYRLRPRHAGPTERRSSGGGEGAQLM